MQVRSWHGDTLVSAGGRVLSVTGTGTSIDEARARAYAGVEKISFEGAHHRNDIGLAASGAGGEGGA